MRQQIQTADELAADQTEEERETSSLTSTEASTDASGSLALERTDADAAGDPGFSTSAQAMMIGSAL